MINILEILKRTAFKKFINENLFKPENIDKMKWFKKTFDIKLIKVLKQDESMVDILVKTVDYTYIFIYDKITGELITKGERKNVNLK